MNAPLAAEMLAVTSEEITRMAADDQEFFNQHFFSQAFRQASPQFHREVDELLDSGERYIALKMFRGSAKTTKLRSFAAKRLSFGISRTIVVIGNAQKNSVYTLRWLKKQVERNTKWTEHFRLRQGAPWSDEHICIVNDAYGIEINIVALGITSQIRGINLEDYRPDLIIADDIDNEETTNTAEQREKTSDLLGLLEKALATPTEDVNAMMCVLQTPINSFDYITEISASEKWKTATYGCFDEYDRSRWEARLTTEFLMKEKAEHIQLRKLSLWMREMECRIVSKETASFDVRWLKYWDTLPEHMDVILAIDPASSEAKTADDQVVGAVGFKGPDIYVCAYTAEKGEMPDAAAQTFFQYVREFRPRKGVVETVAYQKVLKWFLETKMKELRIFLHIEPFNDKRKKSDRIVQALRERAAHGHLYIHSSMTKFVQQFEEYSPQKKMYDDVLDMVSIAISSRNGLVEGTVYEGEYDRIREEERLIPDLVEWRVAI